MVRFVSSIGLAGALLAGALALPVDVPYSVSGHGIVLPAREWLLVRDQDGSLSTLLRDHVGGSVQSADLLRFERGDAVRLRPVAGDRHGVSAGDTILQIRSNETERLLASLAGEVAAAESAVLLYASGEKEAVVERAERSLARAIEEAALARSEAERIRRLSENRLVAAQDVEAAESRLLVLEQEIAIARAELEAVRTGAKAEQLDLARSEADARRRELAAVSERMELLTIRSPLDGVAVRSFGADTLFTVRDTSGAVVAVPVPWKESPVLRVGQPASVYLNAVPLTLDGRLVGVDDTVRRLRGEQVVIATVVVDHPPDTPIVGAVARCEIESEPVRMIEYVRRKILR